MAQSTLIRLKHLALSFIKRPDASVLPTFVLTLIPLVGGLGAAVDYSHADFTRTGLQAALDSALLAGARDGSSNWTNVALNTFNGNLQSRGASVATPTFALNSDRAYIGSVTASVPASFLAVFGINSIPVKVSATAAVKSTSGAYYCAMALNSSAQNALQLTGNASITIKAPKCVLQVNSNSSYAVNLTGNAWISTSQNCFVGGMSVTQNTSVAPAPDAVCKSVPDPFASYPRPTVGACDHTNFSLAGNQAATLQPGVYCGGMSFSGAKASITFAPGLYIIKDGSISETGGSFTGNGVTLFLTGQGASVQMSGQADWHIVAPTGGPLPGFAIFVDPNGPTGTAGTASTLSGQSELYFEGIVYLPKQKVSVTGSATVFAPSPYTSYIGDTLDFTGNGDLVINNDTSLTSVPIPTALMVQTGGNLALTQ